MDADETKREVLLQRPEKEIMGGCVAFANFTHAYIHDI
jgi:hypothetical protein